MKMRRAFLSSIALAFVIAIGAGVTGWGGPSIEAAQWNAATVPVRGIVNGGREDVKFAGNVQIETRLALDPADSSRNKLLVYVDLSEVSGRGSVSGAAYAIKDPETVHHRLLAASDAIDVAFPFSPASSRPTTSTRSGRASFSLTIDTTSGAVLAAMGSIGNVQ